MPKTVLPDRYEVSRRGTPDPADAAYYVLDLAHDFHARICARALVRYYRDAGQQIAADELEHLLEVSDPTLAEMIRKRNEADKATTKKKATSKKQTFVGD